MELELLWNELKEQKSKLADLAIERPEEEKKYILHLCDLMGEASEVVLTQATAQYEQPDDAPIAVFVSTLHPGHREFLIRVDRQTGQVRGLLRFGKNFAAIGSVNDLREVMKMLEKENPQTPKDKEAIERLKQKCELAIKDATPLSSIVH